MDKPNKWHVAAVVLGLMAAFLLINYTILPIYKVGCCVFNGERTCGDCGEAGWDGNCDSNMSLQIQAECCMEGDMCGGAVENPSDCYHRYCTASDKYCTPGEYDIATLNYECTCSSTYR